MDFNDEELYQVADIYNHYVLNDVCTFEVRQQRKTISWKTRITSLLMCPPLFLFHVLHFQTEPVTAAIISNRVDKLLGGCLKASNDVLTGREVVVDFEI